MTGTRHKGKIGIGCLLSTESMKYSTRHRLAVMVLLESNRACHDCFSGEKANQLFKMEKAITDMF